MDRTQAEKAVDAIFDIVASAGNGGLGPYATRILTVGDLRRAREAYLKAKGE